MKVYIPDDALRALCEQQRLANKKLGTPCARKLRSRLADIVAAASVSELVAGRPHPLKGDREGQFSLSLNGGVRLVFEPAHNPVPQLASGGIDWAQIKQVNILFIGDYHD